MSVNWYGPNVFDKSKKLMGTKLRLIAILVHRRMQTQMTGRPSGGKDKKHIPSLPGQPPAVYTGHLRASINWELNDGTSSKTPGTGEGATIARIGVPEDAIYGAYLEVGTVNVKARPFMVPALRYVEKELGNVFR